MSNRFYWLVLFLIISQMAYSQDLPGSKGRLETITTGSYIIPMDMEKQSKEYTTMFDTINYQAFNLHTYGLVYALLENGIPVKWAIRDDKLKDEADFSALSVQKFPIQGSESEFEYISSAFIIDIRDIIHESCIGGSTSLLTEVDKIIQNFGNQVNIYELRETKEIEIRYQINSAPKVAILSGELGFEDAHLNILKEAGFPDDSREILTSQDFFQDYGCYSFISQPHLDEINDPEYIPSLQAFLEGGGNFLAQCIGVYAFELAGKFQTETGLWFTNPSFNESYKYHNVSMPVAQFEGDFPSGIAGTISTYKLEQGNALKDHSYLISTNQDDDLFMTGADVNGKRPGGNVFYFGGHEFSPFFITSLLDGNGDVQKLLQQLQQVKRTYLNAVFVPTTTSFICAGDDVCICIGDSVQLGCADLENLRGTDYSWSPSTGLSCTDCPRPTASPNETTTYKVTTSQSATSSCKEDYVTVEVFEGIQLDTLFVHCDSVGKNYQVVAIISGGVRPYQTLLGGMFDQNIFTSDKTLSGQPYHIQLTDQNGCRVLEFSDSYTCHSCTIGGGFISGDTVCLSEGDSVELLANIQGVGAIEFSWKNPTGRVESHSSNSNSISIFASSEGWHHILNVSDQICSMEVLDSVYVNLVTYTHKVTSDTVHVLPGSTVNLWTYNSSSISEGNWIGPEGTRISSIVDIGNEGFLPFILVAGNNLLLSTTGFF